MIIKQNYRKVEILASSNWPLLVDLFSKWGYSKELLDEARHSEDILLNVADIDKVTDELTAWEIPWKRDF